MHRPSLTVCSSQVWGYSRPYMLLPTSWSHPPPPPPPRMMDGVLHPFQLSGKTSCPIPGRLEGIRAEARWDQFKTFWTPSWLRSFIPSTSLVHRKWGWGGGSCHGSRCSSLESAADVLLPFLLIICVLVYNCTSVGLCCAYAGYTTE